MTCEQPLRQPPQYVLMHSTFGSRRPRYLVLAKDLVELGAVELELAAEDLLVDRVLAGASDGEVAEDEDVCKQHTGKSHVS